jgi:hypothetical protein
MARCSHRGHWHGIDSGGFALNWSKNTTTSRTAAGKNNP